LIDLIENRELALVDPSTRTDLIIQSSNAFQVLDACVNALYVVVLLAGGRLVLHSLGATDTGAEEQKGVRRCFDAGPQGDGVTCMALTEHSLVVGTEHGKVGKCDVLCVEATGRMDRVRSTLSIPFFIVTDCPLLADRLELGDLGEPAPGASHHEHISQRRRHALHLHECGRGNNE
jgi:hypothetical protein